MANTCSLRAAAPSVTPFRSRGAATLKIKDAERLAGGRCLKTPFGTFNVPNISPDKETGIGNWTTLDFVTAMKRGIAPDGTYLYPAFPYTSYQRMTL